MLLGVAIVLTAVVLAIDVWIGDHQDWYNYSNAVQRVLHGTDLYAREQLSGAYNFPSTVKVGYSYPPPSVLLFLPFASNPWGLLAYTALSAAVFLSGLAAVVRRELGYVAPGPLALVLLAVNLHPGYHETLRYGNVDLFIAGAFAWLWALPRPSDREQVEPRPESPALELLAGAGLAAATVIKLFPAFFVAWSAKDRNWRALAATAAFVVGLLLASLAVLGVSTWSDYVVALGNVEPACSQAVSLPCLLVPALGVAGAKAAAIVVSVGLAAAALVVRSRVLGFALLSAATVAPVLELWWHYALFPFVALVAAFTAYVARRARDGVPAT